MGTLYNLRTLTEFVYDSSRNLVYMATSDGDIQTFDVATKALTSRVHIGTTLSGLDISPDGSFLLVAEQTYVSGTQSNTDTLHMVALPSWSVSNLTFSTQYNAESGVFDVAVARPDFVLATTSYLGSGTVQFRGFNPQVSPLSAVLIGGGVNGEYVGQQTWLTASEGHRYILVQEGRTSDGPLSLFDSAQGRIIARTDSFAAGRGGGFNTGHSVVSEAAGLVAFHTHANLSILDTALRPVKTLTTPDWAPGQILGVQFNAGGHQLFAWDTGLDALRVYDTQSLAELTTIKLATDLPIGAGAAGQGAMLVVDNGRTLILDTAGGLELVNLAAELKITLTGGSGADSLYGAAGSDTLNGGDGRNYLRGDDGADSIIGGADFDDINGNMGNDTARGGEGGDWVVGGKDDDLLFGDAGGDIVYGNIGNDTCYGGEGDDVVRGGQGDDSVSGDAGSDWLSGDRGNDSLAGGAGADTFNFFVGAGVDRVTDFNAAEGDKVRIEGGAAYSVRQVGADTLIDLGGGETLTLTGVNSSSLPVGWIFTA